MKVILVALLAMFSITANAAIIDYNFDSGAGSINSTVGGETTGFSIEVENGLTVTAGPHPAVAHYDTDAGGGFGAYGVLSGSDEIGNWWTDEWLTFTFTEEVELASLAFNDGDHDKIFNGNETFDFMVDGILADSDIAITGNGTFDNTFGLGLVGTSFSIRNNDERGGFTNDRDGFYVAGFSVNTETDISTNAVDVPEPGTLALMGLGLAGFAASRKRKQA